MIPQLFIKSQKNISSSKIFELKTHSPKKKFSEKNTQWKKKIENNRNKSHLISLKD
jgi:hypothetical protein